MFSPPSKGESSCDCALQRDCRGRSEQPVDYVEQVKAVSSRTDSVVCAAALQQMSVNGRRCLGYNEAVSYRS
jgi:hypothetical protein